MKRFVAQIAIIGMMISAQARAGEMSAMDSSNDQARIYITVGDFQKIIRGTERILSSDKQAGLITEQEAHNSNPSIDALKSMSTEDKAELYKKVLPIAKNEAQALSSVVQAIESKLVEIKKERKALQLERLSNGSPSKTQEKLFANILEESNLEAKLAETKRQIEESNVLVVEFKTVGSQTVLAKVTHKSNQIWSNVGANSSQDFIAQK